MIDVLDAVACPDTSAEHAPYAPLNPPAGTAIENWSVVPVSEPDTVPRPVIAVAVSASVIVPLIASPD